MPVTITPPTTVGNYLPSRNPLIFTLSTTNTNARLSYIINIYIDNVLATHLKYPVYDRNSLDIDLSTIANDVLTYHYVNDTQLYTNELLETAALMITVDEEYFDPILQQMVVDRAAGTMAGNIYVWLSAADFQKQRDLKNFYKEFDWKSSSYDDFGKFLGAKNWCEDVPLNTLIALYPNPNYGKPILFKNLYKVSPTTQRTASFFTTSTATGTSTHTMYLHCWVYGSDYKLNKRFRKKIHNATYTTANFLNKIGVVPVGIGELNAITWDWSSIGTGLSSYIDPTEDKYYFITVCGEDAFGSALLQIGLPTYDGCKWLGFELVPCNRYTTYNILYKTTEGGWWQIRADKKHFNQTEVKTSVKYNTWGLSAGAKMPDHKRFIDTVHTEATGTITLNTDWIDNQGIINEIEDMIISPYLYLIEETDTDPVIIPVQLKDSTHQIWDKGQDRLVQYSFEFQEAYDKPTLK